MEEHLDGGRTDHDGLHGSRASADPNAISLVVDRVGRIRNATSSFARILGLADDEVLGRPLLDVVDPNDRERLDDFVGQVQHVPETESRLAVRFSDVTKRPVWMEFSLTEASNGFDTDREFELRPYVASVNPSGGDGVESDSNRYHALVQNSADIVLVLDPDGTVRFANPAMLRTLGLAPADLLGTQILELIHPDDQVAVTALMVGVLEQPALSRRVEFRARHVDGSYRWIEGRARNLLDHPEVGGILGNGRDITDRRLTEAALRASEERFRSLAASSPSAIFELDAAARVTYANERWFAITGRSEESGGDLWDALRPSDAHRLRAEWADHGWPNGIDANVQVVRPDGNRRWVQLRTRPVHDVGGVVGGQVGILHDVTDVHLFQEQLAHRAVHDALTGLPNRVELVDRLEVTLARTRREATRLAVLFVDLDRFKVVNDSLGHQAGDEVLKTVARQLLQLVRPGDLVTRFGGDEFVIICEGIVGDEQAMELAGRIQRGLGGRVDVHESQVHISASIGVVIAEGHELAGDLLRDADAAMYEAKTRGRGRAQAFDSELRRIVVERLSTEQALRRGLERNEFTVHFQPIINLDGNYVEAAEALLRWNHPEEGLLGPDRFLAVAEESGLLAPIGSLVLEQACQQAVRWPADEMGRHVKVFVNLAGSQLADAGLAAEVSEITSRTGLAPDRLYLEVTEGILMAGAGAAAKVLHDLRDLGVRIAIDDFGTGYSSLSYLTRLPVDLLKVDQSFVFGMGSRPGDYEVTAAIIALAQTLGLQALAEGVETAAQLEALRLLSCDAAQGFLFSRALPGSEFMTFMAHWPDQVS